MSKENDKAFKQNAVINNVYDHCENVAEELKMNGFDVKVIKDTNYPIIECDTIAGRIKYSCSEKTIMGDYYRFISHFGSRLHKWGLEHKIKCSNSCEDL